MIDWEDILNEFIEGGLIRADVEALRWRIQLPPEARQAVDRDLRLADDLAASGAMMAPAAQAAGRAAGRIGAKLDGENAVQCPAHWIWNDGAPSIADRSDAFAGEDATLVNKLTELRGQFVPPLGALDRLLKRIGDAAMPGEAAGSTTGEHPMRLFPAGEEGRIDALAASKDVRPVDDEEPETPDPK